jgi:hypothetical protein
MTISEVSGFLASSLVFVTFWMKSPIRLRCVAICSNVAFLSYGIGVHLAPVVILHSALLPVNIWRLQQHWGGMTRGALTLQDKRLTCYNFNSD